MKPIKPTLLSFGALLVLGTILAIASLSSCQEEAVPLSNDVESGVVSSDLLMDQDADAETPTENVPSTDVVVPEDVAPPHGPTVLVSTMLRDLRRESRVKRAPSFLASTSPVGRSSAPEQDRLRGHHELSEVTILVFSRLCVSEANWIHHGESDPNRNHAEIDCPAIYRVVRRNRARGETLLGSLRRHTHYVTELWEPRSRRTKWIVNLNLENTRPEHFPRSLNWERDYMPRWIETQNLTRRLLAGRNLGVCANAPIIAWGGRCDNPEGACDDHIAERRGLVPYDCGNTANRFWCRPGTRGCDDPTPVVETPPVEDTQDAGTAEPPLILEGLTKPTR